MRGSITNIADLQAWFFQVKKPFWTLYRGHPTTGKSAAARMLINTELEDIDEAWDMLHDNLKRVVKGGGKFKVFVTDKAGTTNGFSQLLFFQGAQANVGINGTPQNAYIGSTSIEEYISKSVEEKVRAHDQDRRIQDLEAALQEKNSGGVIGKLSEQILNHPQISAVCLNILNSFTGAPINPQMTQSVQGPPSESNDSDQSSLEHSLLRIQKHFPDIVDFMETLSNWIESNPEMAKTLLKNQLGG